MHSATKYLNGHSDVIAGALATARVDEFWTQVKSVRAAHGAIISAHAFAGSVERISPESKAVISAGEVWTPPPPAASLAAFRAGWSALHEGRNTDALAAFERASDPVIAEEAAFWAAVAAQRANDREGAAQRFRAFLVAYPQSSRADAARAALQQLP